MTSIGIVITAILAGGSILANSCDGIGFWLGVSLITIASLTAILFCVWRLWYSNKGWKFRTSDDKTLWRPYLDFSNKQPVLWESGEQQAGMFYELDLGRVKKITKVRFSDGQVCRLPLKSRFVLRRDNADMREEKENKYPECSDEVELKPPFKARYIRMQIVEPEPYGEPRTWRVEAVYVKVKTWIGLKHTIGSCFLDKL